MSPTSRSVASTASVEDQVVAPSSEPAGNTQATKAVDNSATPTNARIALREFHEMVIQTVLDSVLALEPPLLDPRARDAVDTYLKCLREELSEKTASKPSVHATYSEGQVRQSHLQASTGRDLGTEMLGVCEPLIGRHLFRWRETFVADNVVTRDSVDKAFTLTVQTLDNLVLGAQMALGLPRSESVKPCASDATPTDAQTRTTVIKDKADKAMALCNRLPKSLSADCKHATLSDGTPHRGHVYVDGNKGALEDTEAIFSWTMLRSGRMHM